LYTFLVRRTDSKFNKIVLTRLAQTRQLKRPIPFARIAKFMGHRKTSEGKIAVVVGTVTNDSRVMEVPKLQICALKFTETARRRIIEAGNLFFF
jgi:large subunit ribosomal protein L18e